MMAEGISRIIIAKTAGKYKIFGDLKKCKICGINYTAIQPCIVCSMIEEKEKKLKRKLTEKEFSSLFEWLR
jgi:hypothetical protein